MKTIDIAITILIIGIIFVLMIGMFSVKITGDCPTDRPRCEECAHNLTYITEHFDCCTKGVNCP